MCIRDSDDILGGRIEPGRDAGLRQAIGLATGIGGDAAARVDDADIADDVAAIQFVDVRRADRLGIERAETQVSERRI